MKNLVKNLSGKPGKHAKKKHCDTNEMGYNYGTTEDTKNCITNPVTCDIGVKENGISLEMVGNGATDWPEMGLETMDSSRPKTTCKMVKNTRSSQHFTAAYSSVQDPHSLAKSLLRWNHEKPSVYGDLARRTPEQGRCPSFFLWEEDKMKDKMTKCQSLSECSQVDPLILDTPLQGLWQQNP